VEISVPPTLVAESQVPEGGQALTDIGIDNGPALFSIPDNLDVDYKVDQSNTIILVMDVSNGEILHDYLSKNLDGMGFNITGKSDDSLTFTAPGWEGAFTIGDGVAVLNLTKI
jgi:hypothetical protein